MSFLIWSVSETCIRRAAAHSVLPRGFLLVIWVSSSNVAVGAVVASSLLVATGEAVCVGVAPTATMEEETQITIRKPRGKTLWATARLM